MGVLLDLRGKGFVESLLEGAIMNGAKMKC